MPKICSGEPNARAEGCGGQVKGKGPCRKWQRTAVIGGAVSEVSGGKGPRSAAQYSSPWKRLLFDSLDFNHAPGLDTGAVLGFPERLRVLPAPDIPGRVSKPKGTPRKYQSGPSSWAATASGEGGDSTGSCLEGVGIIGARFAAGMWIYSRSLAFDRATQPFRQRPR